MAKKKPKTSLPTLPPLPGLTQVQRGLKISSVLPPGSIRGKQGGTVKTEPEIPTEVPESELVRYPRMSLPEYIWKWQARKLGYEEGIDFVYQFSLLEQVEGLVRTPDSTVADYLTLTSGKCGYPSIAVYVNGNYFHYERGFKIIQNDLDIIARVQAIHKFDVVICDEDDLYENPYFIVKECIESRKGYSQLEGRY